MTVTEVFIHHIPLFFKLVIKKKFSNVMEYPWAISLTLIPVSGSQKLKSHLGAYFHTKGGSLLNVGRET